MTPYGPIYCETGHPWFGMAEPVNTLTNIFILLAAYFAFRRLRAARIGYPWDIVFLLILLTVTGIGSFLWHGLRQPWALRLDALPGLLFLFVFAGFWLCRLTNWITGVIGGLLLCVVCFFSIVWAHGAMAGVPPNFYFIPAFAIIALCGAGLVAGTAKKFGAALAWRGAIVLLCGIAAAVCRSIDPLMCSVIPFGTHFLWHIGLSTAAYLGITMLIEMRKPRGI
jgi:hypothetical protein